MRRRRLTLQRYVLKDVQIKTLPCLCKKVVWADRSFLPGCIGILYWLWRFNFPPIILGLWWVHMSVVWKVLCRAFLLAHNKHNMQSIGLHVYFVSFATVSISFDLVSKCTRGAWWRQKHQEWPTHVIFDINMKVNKLNEGFVPYT